jgi:4-hydroxybenzoate polyprenyltransferase
MHIVEISQSCWIPICAMALTFQTHLLLDPSGCNAGLVLCIGAAAHFGYHGQHPNRVVRWLSWCCGAVSIVLGLFLYVEMFWSALPPIVAWLAYYGFDRPGQSDGLRAYRWAKPVLVAFTWAWMTVWLPMKPELWLHTSGIWISRFGLVFALAIAYDVIDRKTDQEKGFLTWAGANPRRSNQLIISALMLSVLGWVGSGYFNVITNEHAATGLGTLVLTTPLLYLILRSGGAVTRQKFLVDGLMVLQTVVIYLNAL